MVYGPAGAASRTATVDVAEADRTRFCITDADIIELARQALIIEEHYGCPMDIEWGKDGDDGKIYILQARPETVQSRAGRDRAALRAEGSARRCSRAAAPSASASAQGPPASSATSRDVARAERRRAGRRHDRSRLGAGDEARRAIVTNRGGRTCHAAIIARELGIPAVVGCGDATETIARRRRVTVSCAEGDTGFVYDGAARLRAVEDRARRAADDAGQDHDERRQPRPRVRLRRHSRTRASASRASSSSSTA